MSKEINIKRPGQILDYVDTREHLLDLFNYITNLQMDIDQSQEIMAELTEENERLKDNRDWWKDRFFGQQEYDDSHRITAIEYKKRIDKTIEYINNFWKQKSYYESIENCLKFADMNEFEYNDLLDILQNGSEDNENIK